MLQVKHFIQWHLYLKKGEWVLAKGTLSHSVTTRSITLAKGYIKVWCKLESVDPDDNYYLNIFSKEEEVEVVVVVI